MNDIPEDIMSAAEKALDNMLCHCVEASGSYEAYRIDSVKEIALAILAERKREHEDRFNELQAAYRRGVDYACEAAGISDEDYVNLWRFVPKAAYDYADKETCGVS